MILFKFFETEVGHHQHHLPTEGVQLNLDLDLVVCDKKHDLMKKMKKYPVTSMKMVSLNRDGIDLISPS